MNAFSNHSFLCSKIESTIYIHITKGIKRISCKNKYIMQFCITLEYQETCKPSKIFVKEFRKQIKRKPIVNKLVSLIIFGLNVVLN